MKNKKILKFENFYLIFNNVLNLDSENDSIIAPNYRFLTSFGNTSTPHGTITKDGIVIIHGADTNSVPIPSTRCSNASFENYTGCLLLYDTDKSQIKNIIINGISAFPVKDPLGGIFLFGNFSDINGIARQNLAYIDNTGNLSDWNPGSTTVPFSVVADETHVYLSISSSSSSTITSIVGGVTGACFKIDRTTGLAETISMSYMNNPRLYLSATHIYCTGGKSHSSYSNSFAGRSGTSVFRASKVTKLNDSSWNVSAPNTNTSYELLIDEERSYVYFRSSSAQTIGGVNCSFGRLSISSPTVDSGWLPATPASNIAKIVDYNDDNYVYVVNDQSYTGFPTFGGSTLRIIRRIPHASPTVDTTWGFNTATFATNSCMFNISISNDKVLFNPTYDPNTYTLNGVIYTSSMWAMDLATLTTSSFHIPNIPGCGYANNSSSTNFMAAINTDFATIKPIRSGYSAFEVDNKNSFIQDKSGNLLKSFNLVSSSRSLVSQIKNNYFLFYSNISSAFYNNTSITKYINKLDPVTLEIDSSWNIDSSLNTSTSYLLEEDPYTDYVYCRQPESISPFGTFIKRFNPEDGTIDTDFEIYSTGTTYPDFITYDADSYYITLLSSGSLNNIPVGFIGKIMRNDLSVDTSFVKPTFNTYFKPQCIGDYIYFSEINGSTRLTVNGVTNPVGRFNKNTGILDSSWNPSSGMSGTLGYDLVLDLTGQFEWSLIIPRVSTSVTLNPRLVNLNDSSNYIELPIFCVSHYLNTIRNVNRSYLSPKGEFISCGFSPQKESEIIQTNLGVIAFNCKEFLP